MGPRDPILAASGAVQRRRSFIDTPGAFRRVGLAVEAQVVDRECPEVVRRGLAPRRPGAGGRKRWVIKVAKPIPGTMGRPRTLEYYLTSPPPPLQPTAASADAASRYSAKTS